MKIVNTNMHYQYFTWEYFVQAQADIGVRYAEIYGSTPHVWIDHYDYTLSHEFIKKLTSSGVTPIAFSPKPYNYYLGVIDENISTYATAYYKNCIKLTNEIGINLMNMKLNEGPEDIERNKRTKQLYKKIHELCEFAEKFGIDISITVDGNSKSGLISRAKELREFKDTVAGNNLKILMDVGMLDSIGESVEEWLSEFGQNIAFIYLPKNVSRATINKIISSNYNGFIGIKNLDEKDWNNPKESDRKYFTRIMELLRGHNEQ